MSFITVRDKQPAGNRFEIFKLGRHRILWGDATDAGAWRRLLAGETPRLLIADPPYNLGIADWDTFPDETSFRGFTASWLAQALAYLDPAGWQAFISFSQRYLALLIGLLAERKLELNSLLIWHYRNRPRYTKARLGLKKTYDPVAHFGTRPLFFPEPWDDSIFDVWSIPTPQANYRDRRFHPAQKPLELFRRFIRLGSRKGEIVIDPFGGSGTTLLAAESLGRRAFIIEKDERYVALALERWRDCVS